MKESAFFWPDHLAIELMESGKTYLIYMSDSVEVKVEMKAAEFSI